MRLFAALSALPVLLSLILLSSAPARAEYGAGVDGFSLQWTPSHMLEADAATTPRRPSIVKTSAKTSSSSSKNVISAKAARGAAHRKQTHFLPA